MRRPGTEMDGAVRGVKNEWNLGQGEGGAPLVFQNVEADSAVVVHVAVVNFRREAHL